MQFIDLAAQRERLGESLSSAINRVVESGAYILGPEVSEFEGQLAEYVGIDHAIGCANGTDALLIPLMAAGVGPGDAIFVPSFTFAATAEVVALTGAEPVFIDVEPEDYNLSASSLLESIQFVREEGRLRPRGIIPVDLFGQPADYKALSDIAAREDLLIVEDAAQSMGGITGGRKCGSFGMAAGTSFYPAKPLGCYGDGGAMFTNDAALAEVLRSIAFHGRGNGQYDNVRIGLNSRLDTIQAAVLIEKLKILDEERDAREIVAKRYMEGLADVVRLPRLMQDTQSAWAQFAIETQRRDALKNHLADKGIPSVVYYPKPLHMQDAYRHFPAALGGLPVSEKLSGKILCLPMHPYLSAESVDRIVQAIREFAGNENLIPEG